MQNSGANSATELAAGSLPMGQGDTWNNKEEFQRKNHLLALLQFLEKGLQCSPIDRLSCGTSSAAQTDAGLLCEGARLASLSCQMFGTHCLSLQRMLRASREQARFHMKANGSELESRKPWSCQASQQGLRHGPKALSDKQGRLGIARQPATGQRRARDEPRARTPVRTLLAVEECFLRFLMVAITL
jgi:hypothetical protein